MLKLEKAQNALALGVELRDCNYSLSPLTANSLFQVSKHHPLGIRILVQSARG